MKTEEHARRFNRGAQGYATNRYPGRGQCMQKVLDFLDPQPDDIILDVGCGPGTQLMGLAPSIRSGYGIDPAEQMIRRATDEAAGCPNLRFYIGSAQQLPENIRNAGVNKIFSNYALHHLPDETKNAAIHGLAKLLPSGGMLALGDLMFSDDPEKHHDLIEFSGYGPGADTPAYVSALERMFGSAGLSTTTHILNPLIGVIVGVKTQQSSDTKRKGGLALSAVS
jgi:ubiquinone/menaquinone biosynthesis C-methylase UbiE